MCLLRGREGDTTMNPSISILEHAGSLQNLFETNLILFGTPQLRSEPNTIYSTVVFLLFILSIYSQLE